LTVFCGDQELEVKGGQRGQPSLRLSIGIVPIGAADHRNLHATLMGMRIPVRRANEEEDHSRSSLLTRRTSLVILVVVYLAFALTFSLLTRAWEADDEVAHTQYIEYIVKHHSIPHISIANNIESHQPPLYYLLGAGWQSLLGIPAFVPDAVPVHYKNSYIRGRLVYSHNYTAAQHREAVYIHELRLLSIILGLGTVLLTYAAAKVAGMRESACLCAGLFVALLPRELVVSTSVTNDALVIPLCALALVLFLLAERARAPRRSSRRPYVLGMGLALGAAAATKFNSLPVAAVLLALVLLPSIRLRLPRYGFSGDPTDRPSPLGLNPQALLDGVVAIIGFLAISGWWFAWNKHLYGQFLATQKSRDYLKNTLFLHPVSWSTHMFVSELPATLKFSMWYLQPNLVLPGWMNSALSAVAVLSLLGGVWVLVMDRQWLAPRMPLLSALALLGCIVGGVIAVVIIIKSVGYSDARLAYVGLSAIAIALVAAVGRLSSRMSPRLESVGLLVWPVALFAVDLYVLSHFLIPLGGL
jgi:hypothetical protein